MGVTAMDRLTTKVPLLIFPCNGNGVEALGCLGHWYRCIGFIDDTPTRHGVAHGVPLLPRGALEDHPDAQVLAVPGSAISYLSRSETILSLAVDDSRYARVVHPRAWVSPLATVGRNVLLMAGVVITGPAVIGDNVCILPNTVIHHDVRIGPWTLIGANVTVAGHTVVGSNCYIGSGSSIMNGLHIGDRALVGLGSNVIRNVAAEAKVAGNPARVLP